MHVMLKKCEWSSEPHPGLFQAGPSTTAAVKAPSSKATAVPSTPTTSKLVVVKIPMQHWSHPSVKAMQEIAAEIQGLHKAYNEWLDQEVVRMKWDKQHFCQGRGPFQCGQGR